MMSSNVTVYLGQFLQHVNSGYDIKLVLSHAQTQSWRYARESVVRLHPVARIKPRRIRIRNIA